jgi:hypothetical protein
LVTNLVTRSQPGIAYLNKRKGDLLVGSVAETTQRAVTKLVLSIETVTNAVAAKMLFTKWEEFEVSAEKSVGCGACNAPNALVIPFRLDLVRAAA